MTEPLRPDHDPAADTSVRPVPTATHVAGAPADAAPAVPAAPADPPSTPVATEAVAPPTTTNPVTPRGRGRWIAAGAIVGAVVIASAAIGLALTASAPRATVTGYVPADSITYVELRLDLPGDQRAELAEFLARFPGFADQAALETKLDEVLDSLVREATDGEQTFSADIKPWFDGEIAMASGPLAGDREPASGPVMFGQRALALISIKDEALARAWFDEILTEGTTTESETYNGTEILTYSGPDDHAAFAIVGGEVAVAGDPASVKAAIDTKGDSGFADEPDVKAAFDSMDGDSIAFGYLATGELFEASMDLLENLESAPPLSADMAALVPDWTAFRVRVEGDALEFDGTTPPVDGAPGPDTDHANGVAAWAPPSTIALGAGNDVGATVEETLEWYRSQPGMADMVEQIEGFTGLLGGVDGLTGWMGDTGIVVSVDGETPEGGLVSIPTDAAKARQLLTSLKSFVALGGAQLGITTAEEDHQGATITTITVEDPESLAGMAGGQLPTEGAEFPFDRLSIAFTATDDVVVIGSGPDFVKAVLDAGPGPSLADGGRYQAAVGRVGDEHTGVSFVDVTAVRTLIEAHLDDLSAEERAEYVESIQPFLTPFDTFAAATVVGGDVNASHAVLTVQ